MKISRENLQIAIKKLPNLKELHIIITDTGNLDFLQALPKLRVARIEYSGNLLHNNRHKLHDLPPNNHMTQLDLLFDRKICHMCINQMTHSFPRLTSLSIEGRDVNDKDLHVIFKHLKLLRELRLLYCDAITDAGLTGFVNPDGVMRHELSLLNLKGLQVLDISGSRNISDTSLLSVFRHAELREIRMPQYSMITDRGVDAVVQHCPVIEVLDLRDCNCLTGCCIESICVNLRRLKVLNVRSLTLNEDELKHVFDNCAALQFLHCQNHPCQRFFEKIQTLRAVYHWDQQPCLRDLTGQRTSG